MEKNQAIHDGIYLSFYNYLWTKLENAKEKYSKIKVNIPETVIFYESQPIDWYFTDNEGIIKRKKRENLSLDEVEKRILKNQILSGIPCYFIHYKKFSKICVKPEEPVIEYLTSSQLKEIFLDCKTEKIHLNGILQSFIEPIGNFNTTIQANWSKALTVFSKRKNVKNLFNKKLSPFERSCTFDGPVFFSEEVPAVGRVTEEIRNICDSMVQHVNDVSYGNLNIIRMLLYFKQGSDGKCYFMFGTSMRVENSKRFEEFHYQPLNMENQMKIPKSIKQNYTSNLQKPLDLKLSINCLGCSEMKQSSDFTEVSYKQIQLYSELKQMSKENKKLTSKAARLQSHRFKGDYEKEYVKEVFLRDEKLGIILKEKKVPAVFKSLYNNINDENYSVIGKLLKFQQNNIILCWQCYFEITKLLDEENKLKEKNKDFKLFNRNSLNFKPKQLQPKEEFLIEEHETKSQRLPVNYITKTYLRPQTTHSIKFKRGKESFVSNEISTYLSTKTTNISHRGFQPKSANLLRRKKVSNMNITEDVTN